MAITDKAETRKLRWKTHDAAQLVTAMHVRKVRQVDKTRRTRPEQATTARAAAITAPAVHSGLEIYTL